MEALRTRDLHLVVSWFGACYLALMFALFFLFYLSSDHILTIKHPDFRLYAALPATNLEIEDQIVSEDGRALILENYLNSRGSILAAHSSQFVNVADKYQLDFRLLPAIALQESGGAKRFPNESFNPFGFGIYGSSVLRFESFDEAIEVVGRSMREDYIDQGLTNPYTIMTKYTPSSESKGSPWAIGVTHFMEELK